MPMMIRISDKAHSKLKFLASENNTNMSKILNDLILQEEKTNKELLLNLTNSFASYLELNDKDKYQPSKELLKLSLSFGTKP
jgi:hypothetical protein